MKKKNSKKKLPRYDIGKPIARGYQRNMGIGAASFKSERGEDLTPEVSAMRQSLIPNAIARLGLNAQYPTQALQNMKTVTNTITTPTFASLSSPFIQSAGASVLPAMSYLAISGATRAGLPTLMNTSLPSLATPTMTPTLSGGGLLGGFLTQSPATQLSGTANAANLVPSNVTSTTTSHVLNAAGKVAAVLGTAYGAYNVTNDIMHAGDTITTGQIANTRGTNTITTAGGNTYTEKTGADANAAMEYERLAKTAKQIGLGTDLMGLGASAGGLLGSVVPGVGTILGTIGGAGLGLVAGGIASLLGFGDNEEEVQRRINLINDTTALENRQSEGLAKNQDTRDAFYGNAANGKMPGFRNGKANARVSNGEVIGNFKDGYFRVPGGKNNEDNVKTHLGKLDFVISNKHGLSDYAWLTGDIPGALAALSYLQKTGQMNKYKNGRLPKFDTGTWQYANAILPHMFGFLENLALLNRVKNSDRTAPQTEVPDAGASRAINDMYADRIDERDYLRLAYDLYRLQLWEGRRTPGIGLGGRMLYATNLGTQAQRQLADTRLKIDELNRAQRNTARQMQVQNALNIRAHELDNFWKTAAMRQQINSAYEKYRAQIPLNQYNILSSLGSNLSQIYNTNNALDIQNRMLKLYEQGAETDKRKADAWINSLGNNTVQNNSTWTPPIWLQRRGYIPSTYDTSRFNWSIRP